MNTVFSHIIQKKLSQQYENVATEALTFILDSSGRARTGLMKLLRGIAPDLPDLRFRIQHTEGDTRPDMCGLDGGTPRAFIENKFWAGLTDGQPVEYLKKLASHPHPAMLLVVVPAARLGTVWREMDRSLREKHLPIVIREPSAGVFRVATIDVAATDLDAVFVSTPILAITSWAHLLSALENELVEEPQRRNDLLQLRALCDVADHEALAPFAADELTDQRTPAFVFRLNSIVQGVVQRGISEHFLSVDRLRESHSWERLGRYIRLENGMGVGAWFGIDFSLWRKHGSTPLWLNFSPQMGRASEVRKVLEPWAETKGIIFSTEDDHFVLGIHVPAGEEHNRVIGSIVKTLECVSKVLSRLPPALAPDDTVEKPCG